LDKSQLNLLNGVDDHGVSKVPSGDKRSWSSFGVGGMVMAAPDSGDTDTENGRIHPPWSTLVDDFTPKNTWKLILDMLQGGPTAKKAEAFKFPQVCYMQHLSLLRCLLRSLS
jgi:hypothetical protein